MRGRLIDLTIVPSLKKAVSIARDDVLSILLSIYFLLVGVYMYILGRYNVMYFS